MIKNIYKNIHSRYANYFKFFFYIRFLIAIILIAALLLLLIPKFFDFDKNKQFIREYLSSNYKIEFNDIKNIKYNIFPSPNLSVENINLNDDKISQFKIKKANLFVNLKGIYDFDYFKVKTLKIYDSEILIEINKVNHLIHLFQKIKSEIKVKNLNLFIKKEMNDMVKINNLDFSNYGYKKYDLKGLIFEKQFEVNFKDEKNIHIKLYNTGLEANFNLDKKDKNNFFSGSSKINLLNNILKFDFVLNNDKLKMSNSKFRNKDISIKFDSQIEFNPFYINSNIEIDKLNKNLFKNFNVENVFDADNIIKKFNSRHKLNYVNKKSFRKNFITSVTSDLELANGRLDYSYKLSIDKNLMNCNGWILLTEDFPKLNFKCNFIFKDPSKFLKKFSVNKKIEDKTFLLYAEGYLNILKNKVKLDKITLNKKENIKKEDLKYYKEKFETYLYDEKLMNLFDNDKIKKFLQEVI